MDQNVVAFVLSSICWVSHVARQRLGGVGRSKRPCTDQAALHCAFGSCSGHTAPALRTRLLHYAFGSCIGHTGPAIGHTGPGFRIRLLHCAFGSCIGHTAPALGITDPPLCFFLDTRNEGKCSQSQISGEWMDVQRKSAPSVHRRMRSRETSTPHLMCRRHIPCAWHRALFQQGLCESSCHTAREQRAPTTQPRRLHSASEEQRHRIGTCFGQPTKKLTTCLPRQRPAPPALELFLGWTFWL